MKEIPASPHYKNKGNASDWENNNSSRNDKFKQSSFLIFLIIFFHFGGSHL